MALDAPTMLTVTLAIAASASAYLVAEWRSLGERAQLYWSGGFASIALGCALAPLRESTFLVGVWVADGLLIVAHFLFLLGVGRFTARRVSRPWYTLFALWAGLLVLPYGPSTSVTFGALNSLLVAALSLKASSLLISRAGAPITATGQLRYVLLGHGLFYTAKAMLVFVPGALVDLRDYQGLLIPISLLEGVVVEVLIALSMTGAVRRRREKQIEQLAERDPLTGILNRRAFNVRAAHRLKRVDGCRPAALISIDIDHFKLVNDHHGHGAGDRLLVLLGEILRSLAPETTLVARLGGDEFAILLTDSGAVDVMQTCTELRERFAQKAKLEVKSTMPITLSIGAVRFDRPSDELNDLHEHADTALYVAKRDGRNQLVLVDRSTRQAPIAGEGRASEHRVRDWFASHANPKLTHKASELTNAWSVIACRRPQDRN